jgi:hypothetical protein
MTHRQSFSLLFALFPAALLAQAPQDTLVSIGNLSARGFRSAAFSLSAAESITISAVGGEPRGRTALRRFLDNGVFQAKEDRLWDSSVWPGNAWIIDARTREVVWELRTAPTVTEKNGLRSFHGRVVLPVGNYEAGYAALFPVSRRWNDKADWRSPTDSHPDGKNTLHGPYIDDDSYRQFGITLRGKGRKLSADSARPALVALRGATPSTRERLGFELDRAMPVEVYLLGEYDDGWKDYGVIVDAANRSVVWTSRHAPGDPAGGSRKNRRVRQTLNLPAGKYVAVFNTTASHQPGRWSEAPPYDAASWGLAVQVVNETDRKAARTFEYNPIPTADAFVTMTRMDDDELRWQRFTLARQVPLQIFALGEGSGQPMHDYGWIVDASGRVAWTMRYADTQPAGGAEKNRVFAGTVTLPAGTYVAYFVTDGSHSYRGGWNSAEPMDAEYWGMTIAPAVPGRDAPAIKKMDDSEPADPSVLARLTRVRADREEEAQFTLATRSNIRVYAVGEGQGDMNDYGYITDRAGQEVWRMTFAETEPGGGARKNRRVNRMLSLEPGMYVAHFKTDRSHGWGDWNAPPPDDPLAWGMTLYRDGPGKP